MATYAVIEHGLYENPKLVGLSDKAFRAYIESILYAGKHLTDGFLDERIVARMWGLDTAEELSSNDPVNPSWVRVDGGWQIHGFCERQNTKADVDAMRERKRAAGRASAAKRKQEADRKATETQQPVEQKSNTGSTEGQPYTNTDTNTDTNKELKRGTRLQTTFVVTDEMIAWAKEKHPLVDIDTQTDAFIDYWTSVPGQKGVKSDWVATWRNWIRNSRPSLPTKPAIDPDWWMYQQTLETT